MDTAHRSHPPSAVLVVDGSEPSRRQLVLGLRGFFRRVEAAATGSEALLRLDSGSFEGVALELWLPDVSGLALIPLLRDRHPDVRSVVVTGQGSVASSVRAIKLGAADYLIKPVAPVRVAAALAGDPVRVDVDAPEMSLDRVAWEHIQRVLADVDGNISEAARRLRIHRQSLQRMLRKAPPVHERS